MIEAIHGNTHVGLQIGLAVGARIYDPDGTLVEEIVQPGHSFVLAWATMLNHRFSSATMNTTAIDTGNTSRTLHTNTTYYRWNAAAADSTYGIAVGSGTNAVAMTDYALQTQIAHGTGAGQLYYWDNDGYPVDSSGANPRYMNTSRAFQNQSGTTISVSEVALYVRFPDSGAVSRYFCMCRDLLSFNIGVGQLAIVQYSLVFNLT